MTDPTGYDPGTPEKAHPDRQLWNLDRVPARYSSAILAHLTCNNESRGLLRFESEEEFEWMKRLVDSKERRITDEEISRRSE